MARAVQLSDGTTGMFDDQATDAEIDEQLRRDGLTRVIASGPVEPAAAIPGGATTAYLASTANSLAFGLPELAARAMGYGPNIEATRQASPYASAGGDITGLISPAKLAMKATEKAIGYGMSALKSPAARQAEKETSWRQLGASEQANRAEQQAAQAAQAMPRQRTLREMAGPVLRRTAEYGGGLMGAQLGAAALGGARQPTSDFPYYGGAGAQEGADLFRRAAMNAPLTGLVPGLQPTIGAVTGVVPGVLGYGNLAGQYMTTEERIRQEAARRALQGQ